jgi:hypothetical protein
MDGAVRKVGVFVKSARSKVALALCDCRSEILLSGLNRRRYSNEQFVQSKLICLNTLKIHDSKYSREILNWV